MKTLAPRKIWTDEALEALPKERGKFELIDGKLTRMSPAKRDHGLICVQIASALNQHVISRRLGLVFDSSTGFRLDPENVLSPDAAFCSSATLRRDSPALDNFGSVPPDLCVEVISASERKAKIRRKLELYFTRGTRLVWLVRPRRKLVEVYTAPEAVTLKRLDDGDELDGGDVLPGFRLPLTQVFLDWFSDQS